jgi:hypothetical protein
VLQKGAFHAPAEGRDIDESVQESPVFVDQYIAFGLFAIIDHIVPRALVAILFQSFDGGLDNFCHVAPESVAR